MRAQDARYHHLGFALLLLCLANGSLPLLQEQVTVVLPGKFLKMTHNGQKQQELEKALSMQLTLIWTRKSRKCSLNWGMSWSKLNRPSMNTRICVLRKRD